jgi:NADPH:quinone reductase-like Zn-dependent oxidoreductase
VKAVSVNPVDTKVRAGFQGDTPRVLGWDAVGVVQHGNQQITPVGGRDRQVDLG